MLAVLFVLEYRSFDLNQPSDYSKLLNIVSHISKNAQDTQSILDISALGMPPPDFNFASSHNTRDTMPINLETTQGPTKFIRELGPD